jgi:hypothetical protein
VAGFFNAFAVVCALGAGEFGRDLHAIHHEGDG